MNIVYYKNPSRAYSWVEGVLAFPWKNTCYALCKVFLCVSQAFSHKAMSNVYMANTICFHEKSLLNNHKAIIIVTGFAIS